MKISVKTLKGNHFDLDVQPADTVIAVKKQIEDLQGFPCSQQLLIHQGKVLKDETTMDDNKVSENGFLVVMLTKSKAPAPTSSGAAPSTPVQAPAPAPTTPAAPAPNPNPAPVVSPAPATPAPTPAPAPATTPAAGTADIYGQAASNLVVGPTLEPTIQQLLDMGGGSWDRDQVLRALRAAYNNPERAVDYLYSAIPDTADLPPPVARSAPAAPAPGATPTQAAGAPATGPNAVPLDLFPQGIPGLGGAGGVGNGALEFLRNHPQFRHLRAMVQQNPQILQPMLQELGRQNPQLLRLINDNQVEFLRLINEPEAGGEAGEGGIPGAVPQSISVTPEEREAIERLEAMGFDRAHVIEAYLACDKNEQMAANYLLEHAGEYEE